MYCLKVLKHQFSLWTGVPFAFAREDSYFRRRTRAAAAACLLFSFAILAISSSVNGISSTKRSSIRWSCAGNEDEELCCCFLRPLRRPSFVFGFCCLRIPTARLCPLVRSPLKRCFPNFLLDSLFSLPLNEAFPGLPVLNAFCRRNVRLF